ncbi:MAG: hypothetical protein K2W82_04175 [Candidatus Obscuribacterales bacterium]|nr:hypothetical protein [Candidatus Obscuribacterales bacterium]
MKKGSLTIVGTGFHPRQMTIESADHIRNAEKVYFVATSLIEQWITASNSSAESLLRFYGNNKNRLTTYHEMVDEIMSAVRQGKRVCAAFYGHPGIFVYPSHVCIATAREEGYEAQMLPGVSAEDCLVADVGMDPGYLGCQSYEATDFLSFPRSFDCHSALIIWQIAHVGVFNFEFEPNRFGLKKLTEKLLEHYPAQHEVCVYLASVDPHVKHQEYWMPLSQLPEAPLGCSPTLYVPPLASPKADPEFYKDFPEAESADSYKHFKMTKRVYRRDLLSPQKELATKA